MQGVCTEAVLIALRKRYPQIYVSKVKLQLDVSEVSVDRDDFEDAMKQMVPAGRRGSVHFINLFICTSNCVFV